MSGIMLDGVTGAGKTQTLRALMHHPDFAGLLGAGRVFMEDETFGEVMSEMTDRRIPQERHLWRIENVLSSLDEAVGLSDSAGFVLERFHLSYYALLPDWGLYAELDRRLASAGFAVALLWIPESEHTNRCLDRVDRRDAGWTEDMVAHYGSRTAVLQAIAESQRRREAAVAKTCLPVTKIDTTAQDWQTYANTIVEIWKSKK